MSRSGAPRGARYAPGGAGILLLRTRSAATVRSRRGGKDDARVETEGFEVGRDEHHAGRRHSLEGHCRPGRAAVAGEPCQPFRHAEPISAMEK